MDTDQPERVYIYDEKPTIFDYDAKVLILGWEFALMANGEFRIRTSDFTPNIVDGKTSASMRLAPGLTALVRALITCRDNPQKVEMFPPGTKGVGYPGQGEEA